MDGGRSEVKGVLEELGSLVCIVSTEDVAIDDAPGAETVREEKRVSVDDCARNTSLDAPDVDASKERLCERGLEPASGRGDSERGSTSLGEGGRSVKIVSSSRSTLGGGEGGGGPAAVIAGSLVTTRDMVFPARVTIESGGGPARNSTLSVCTFTTCTS